MSKANKTYFKLFFEEVNCALSIYSYIEQRQRDKGEALSDNEKKLSTAFAVLTAINTICYIGVAWYIGFYKGVLRKRCVDQGACTRVLCWPCILLSWVVGSLVAVLFPLWGVQCYCLNDCGCCAESKSQQRMRANGHVIYQRSLRVHAYQDLFVDLPLFVLNLYLNKDRVRGFAVAQVAVSAVLFVHSVHVLSTVPTRATWERTASEVAKDAAIRKAKEEERYRQYMYRLIRRYDKARYNAPIALVFAAGGAAGYFITSIIWFLAGSALFLAFGVVNFYYGYIQEDPRQHGKTDEEQAEEELAAYDPNYGLQRPSYPIQQPIPLQPLQPMPGTPVYQVGAPPAQIMQPPVHYMPPPSAQYGYAAPPPQ